MIWLGVDGGTSKTEAVILSDAGILGFSRGDASNHQGVGLDQAVQTIIAVIESALADAGIKLDQVSRAVLGLAGADFPEDIDQLQSGLAPYFQRVPYAVVNDAEVALAAGTENSYGIVAVAGTGTNVFGRNVEGRALHVGGLGYEYGDYGSGIDLVREVLHSAFRSAEMRGPKTQLEPMVLSTLGQPDYSSLSRALYFHQIPPLVLIVLAPLCFQAAQNGDGVAITILQNLGQALGESVIGCARRLEMLDIDADVVLAGSLWLGRAPHMHDRFRETLSTSWPQARIRVTELKPVVGAALMASQAGPVHAQRIREICRTDPRLKGIE
ncbi:MAG: hypothetical protein OWU33_00840 [Firmicutes bacterium]|nr:hypothetical protein [Bacillota bacterium]